LPKSSFSLSPTSSELVVLLLFVLSVEMRKSKREVEEGKEGKEVKEEGREIAEEG
jgi:hypothetical protein